MNAEYESPIMLAQQYFAHRGFALTNKAKRAAAVATGFAESPASIQDLFVSVGLRRTNSVLALLTDKYSLNFRPMEREVDTLLADREYLEEVRRRTRRFDEDMFLAGLLEDVVEDPSPEVDPSIEKALMDYHALDGTHPFELAIDRARAERRNTVETFDLVDACSELPTLARVLKAARVKKQKLHEELNRYRALEPYLDGERIALTFEENRISVRMFGVLDGYVYEERSATPRQLVVHIGSANAFLMQSTLQEFEELINWPSVTERDIHRFFVAHPELILGDDYVQLHSELILDRGDKGNLIPDFFAELPTSRYTDIIDLKKPNERLLVGRKDRRGLSASVHSAVYQVREYRKYFEDRQRREDFHSKYGLRAFRPKIAVVIGRRPTEEAIPEFVEAQRNLPDCEIVTYDDLIDKARRRVVTIGG